VGVDALNVTKKQLFGVFFIFLAITFLLPTLLQALLKALPLNLNLSNANLDLVVGGISHLTLLGFIILIYKKLHLKKMDQSWTFVLKEGLSCFGAVLPIVLLTSCLWLAFLLFLNKCGLKIPINEQGSVVLFTKLSGFLPKFLFLVMVVVLAPIVEELVFRGVLYRAFRRELKCGAAAILTGVIFATLHFSAISLLPLLVFSILLAKSYDHFGNIWVPIVVHGAFNCNSLILIMLFQP
jgi:membrane protease YdiL (CAAX protease family)